MTEELGLDGLPYLPIASDSCTSGGQDDETEREKRNRSASLPAGPHGRGPAASGSERETGGPRPLSGSRPEQLGISRRHGPLPRGPRRTPRETAVLHDADGSSHDSRSRGGRAMTQPKAPRPPVLIRLEDYDQLRKLSEQTGVPVTRLLSNAVSQYLASRQAEALRAALSIRRSG